MDIGTEHQDLLQFLYAAPVGLVHAALDGSIELINSASARWLLPLSADGRLDNLFTVLAEVAPGLRASVARHGHASGAIVENLRIAVPGGRQCRASPEFVTLTVTRLDDRRLMVVLNDVTRQVCDERALSDSAAHYRAVVSVLSEGVVVHDPGGGLLTCNAAAERTVGAPLPPALPGPAAASGWLPHRPDGQPMAGPQTPTGIVLAGGPAQAHVTVLSVASSGERRWFDVSAQPVIRPGTDELLAVVTSFTEVTQRQRLQDELHQHREHLQELVAQRTRELEASHAALAEQQNLLRAVADAVPGMIGYWDAGLRCRFSNQAYLEWFGKGPQDMLGMSMQEVMGPGLFAQNAPHVLAALQGQPQHFQRAVRKPDGSIGHTLVSYIPDLVDGRARGFNVVASDVTELKQAELRLESLNEQLQRRALQADEATRAKSAFLANMSHEIRTPMNAIVGLAHLMRRETRDALQHQRLGKINDASQHLLHVINDILDLSKIEAGKMTLDDAEIVTDELLARAFGMVSAQARDKRIELVLDCGALPQRLRGDAVRLSQCLINLLTNAVKFTDRGWIRLRVERLADDGPRVLLRFEVQDTGPGIVPDRQASLFRAFEQADNSLTRQHGGTGLGLALTRHFARLMGGDAGVASEPGAGSTFWFTAWLGALAEPAEPAPAAALRGLRVLLVDGLPESLQAVARRLEMLGLEVDAQAGGMAALLRLDDPRRGGRPYDLVLVERAMPPIDGFEALHRMRARLGAAMPPGLLMATYGDDALEHQAAQAGFDAVLVKPVTPSALHDALARALHRGPGGPAARAPQHSEDETRLRQQHAGQRVLLVEDNPVNQEVAVELLQLVGLQVETANDGARAVERVASSRYDIVLMDLQMPVLDGLSAARLIRQQGGVRTPILAMTANAFGDDRVACLAAGMDDHVAKPVDPAALYAALLRWLPPARQTAPTAVLRQVAEPIPARAGTTLQERLRTVSGFDPAIALRSVGGNASVLERTLVRFTQLYADGQDGLAFRHGTTSIDALKAISHSLRGACATVGATALQLELSRFEQELGELVEPAARLQRSRALHRQLEELVAQLRQALAG